MGEESRFDVQNGAESVRLGEMKKEKEWRRGFCTRQNKSWLSSAESAKDSEVPQSTNTNYNVNKKPTHKTGLLAFVSFNS